MSTRSEGTPTSTQATIAYVTGKGGVGKTTVAAALACIASRRGCRAAFVEMGDGDSGARVLASDRTHVSHVVLSYDSALAETLGAVFGSRIIARALVSHHAIRRLVGAVPALREFSFLDRIRALAASKRYDRIVVDLPASGHAVDWLRIPRAFARFLGKSPLGSVGERIDSEVVSNGSSEVVIVALAEPLVIKETEQLCHRLKSELGIAPSLVIVNRVSPTDPVGSCEAAVSISQMSCEYANDASDLSEILLARRERARETIGAFSLARAMDAGTVAWLPEAPRDPLASEVATWLGTQVLERAT